MKNKKVLILFIISVILILGIGYFAIKFVKQKKSNEIQNDEYIPQEEISEEQARETIVSLYFTDKETGLLKPEARLVNVKELMKEPYKTLIELLISGPKNDKLKVVIPENTKILNYIKDDSRLKNNIIYSIVNTVTELNEVNKVKFLVEGQSSNEFEEFYVRK